MNAKKLVDSGDAHSGKEDHPPPLPPIPNVIANWWLNEKLGSGFSGSIFRATHIHTGQEVAIKVQFVHHECPTNLYERKIYPLIQGNTGMPKLYASGVQDVWDYLAIELLGPSLDSLFRQSGHDVMDMRSVCAIAIQVIRRLQSMHQSEVLHRDVQLGNCVIGRPPNNKTLYMIDFGFSKRYIDKYTRRHIPDSKLKRDFIGNYWFSSVNVHCRGKVPSRRDDLEALALMLIHLLTPRGLTWTRNGVPKSTEAHNALKTEKRNATPESLCRGLPSEFEEFLAYTRRLTFKECPDYDSWVERFRGLSTHIGYRDVEKFIWPPPEPVVPLVKTFNTPKRARPVISNDVGEMIHALKRLDLVNQSVLRGLKNTRESVRGKSREDAKVDSFEQQKKKASENTVIVISSGSEADNLVPMGALPKAARLQMLKTRASSAIDNPSLAGLVKEFVDVMKMNSSRTLTREAFGFLDVLFKQLDDPSIFTIPQRTSRQPSFSEQVPEKEPAHVKLGVVARLRREVIYAQSNKALAAMVADFAKVTNKSTGRTITKDGFAFLTGLSERLIVIR